MTVTRIRTGGARDRARDRDRTGDRDRRQQQTSALVAGLERSLSHRRPLPTTVAWRWRYETALVMLASSTGFWLVWLVGAVAAVAIAGALVAVVVAVRPLRRRAVAFGWRLVTPHRIRSGCAYAHLHPRHGRLPTVLSTRRRGWGERVRLWCPAGLCPEDFVGAQAQLRAACWAEDVRIRADPRRAQIVVLDVIRQRRAGPPRGDD